MKANKGLEDQVLLLDGAVAVVLRELGPISWLATRTLSYNTRASSHRCTMHQGWGGAQLPTP